MKTPSSQSGTVVLIIQFAFETFEHIIDLRKTIFDKNLASFLGTFAAAADKCHRGTTFFAAALPTQHDLADMGSEVRIHFPVWLIDPGNVY